MILNIWSRVRLFCGNHGDDYSIEMVPHEAATSAISQRLYGSSEKNMFYACPKYYPENRESGEKCCRNHISVAEFEKMLNHITELMEEDALLGAETNIVGAKWKSRSGVEYRVIHQNDKHIDVVCLNRKGLS